MALPQARPNAVSGLRTAIVRPQVVLLRQAKPGVASQLRDQRRAPGRSISLTVSAQQRISTQLIGGGLGANQIFVAGADGQLGARVVQKLLQAGFKVTAGVPDEEQARSVVSFATSVELLTKQEAQKLSLVEVDLADEGSIASVLPKRGARVVVIVGDSGGSKASKVDARAATRVLLAAQEIGAAQYVLVTPSGSGGGGGFLSALFGGGGASGGTGSKPSKLEQDIASSGLEFVIIRTGRTDIQDPAFEADNNVALGAQGSLPPQARISKNQVAEVVQQVVRLADADVLVEAWASPEAEAVGVEAAVQQALPGAKIEEEELENEAPQATGGLTDESSLEEEVEEAPKKAAAFFKSFGTGRVKAGSSPPPEPTPPQLPSFGTKRVSVKSSAADKESPPTRRPAFGFGKKAAAKEEEEEEEEASYNPTEALRNIFGSKKGSDPLPDVSPEKARKSAAKGIKAVGNAAQKAAPTKARPGRPAADEPKPKKSFLASIGLGGETTYVNDESS